MIGTSATAGFDLVPRSFLIRSKVLFALAALIPAGVSAQSTQTVPPNDPVYAFVDLLVAARLIETVLVGQRTMSRREIGRLLGEARTRLGADTGWIASRLGEYAAIYPETLYRAGRISGTELEMTAAESPSRGIEPDANGAIAVSVNPLLGYRLGRAYANGATGSAAYGTSGAVTSWLAFQIRHRMAWIDERGGRGVRSDKFEQAYARALWKNAAVQVGRDYLFFGQGEQAGLMASLNPRGIDQVRLSSDRPFRLPWILRHIGPLEATMLLGDLGEDQFFPHTRFFAYKVSARPHRSFEIGASLAEQVGGEGAPGGTFGQKAGDAFPLLDALFLHRNFQFSNKFVGVDIRYSIPGVRGLQFYAEGAFDDFDLRRIRSTFTEDAGYIWGASMSCFRECGPVRASAEYHVTGLRFYTHGGYRGGYTVDNQFIGDHLGPRGRGGYGTLDLDRGGFAIRFNAAYEARSGDKYGSVATMPDDADFRFVKIETNPVERRWRMMTSWRRGRPQDVVSYRIGAGLERVENFAHVGGSWRTNWLTQAGVELRTFRK